MPTEDLKIKSTKLTGAEYITITSDSTLVSLDDIRKYVLQGLVHDIKLDQVDNTADTVKPLSHAQRVYIDSKLLPIENKIEQLVTLMSRYVNTTGKL